MNEQAKGQSEVTMKDEYTTRCVGVSWWILDENGYAFGGPYKSNGEARNELADYRVSLT